MSNTVLLGIKISILKKEMCITQTSCNYRFINYIFKTRKTRRHFPKIFFSTCFVFSGFNIVDIPGRINNSANVPASKKWLNSIWRIRPYLPLVSPGLYGLTHKEWNFRDGFTEFIQFFSFSLLPSRIAM